LSENPQNEVELFLAFNSASLAPLWQRSQSCRGRP
jgi:hypothetical protein